MNETDRTDRAWHAYSERFRTETLPRLLSSSVALHAYSGNGADFDVRQATELGAMLLLGRPLIVVSTTGSRVPDGLRRAADVVLDDWRPADPYAQEQLAAALVEATKRGGGGGEP